MNILWNGQLIAALVLAACAGCSAKSNEGLVRGTVTLDGQPLREGRILLVSADQSSPSAEAAIAAGQFEAKAPLGQKRVEIRAPKITGKKKMYDTPDSPAIDVVVELLPAKYNVNSELTMSVDGAEQTKNFDLKSE